MSITGEVPTEGSVPVVGRDFVFVVPTVNSGQQVTDGIADGTAVSMSPQEMWALQDLQFKRGRGPAVQEKTPPKGSEKRQPGTGDGPHYWPEHNKKGGTPNKSDPNSQGRQTGGGQH